MFYTSSQLREIMLKDKKEEITVLETQCVFNGELFEIKSLSGDEADLINNGEMLGTLSLANCKEIEPSKRKLERYNINRETNTISIKTQGNEEMTLKYKESGKYFFNFIDQQ